MQLHPAVTWQIPTAMIDEDEDGSSATALVDLLDAHGAWDWTDDAEHDPSDRVAIVESTGASNAKRAMNGAAERRRGAVSLESHPRGSYIRRGLGWTA